MDFKIGDTVRVTRKNPRYSGGDDTAPLELGAAGMIMNDKDWEGDYFVKFGDDTHYYVFGEDLEYDIAQTSEVRNEHGQSLTVGELIDYLRRFPRSTPVISYKSSFTMEYEDYVNLTQASVQGLEEGSPIVVLDMGGPTDNRGW